MDMEPTLSDAQTVDVEEPAGPPPRQVLAHQAADLIQQGSDRETVVRAVTAEGFERSEAERLADAVFLQLRALAGQEKVSAGNIVAALFTGGLISVLGCVVWLAVAYYTERELGIIAWGIGWLAAKGISMVTRQKRGLALQVIGALSGLGSLVMVKGILYLLALMVEEPELMNQLLSIHDLIWLALAIYIPWRMLKGSGFTFNPGPGWEGTAPIARFE